MRSRTAIHALAAALLVLAVLQAIPAISLAAQDMVLTVPAGWDAARASEGERAFLERVRRFMHDDSSAILSVTGHTDTLGAQDENRAIGFYYASRVADQLKSTMGFEADRMELSSRGESEPLVREGGFEEQERNRRVSIALTRPPQTRVSGQPDSDTTGKNILILEPAAGTVDRAYQKVRAIIEGDSRTALLTINGISSLITVQNSRIDTEVVLQRGENTIEVLAWDATGAFGKDSVEVTYISPPPKIDIETPLDGELFDTTHSLVVDVSGRIEAQTPLEETFLFLNGAPRRIEVGRDGVFSQPVVLIRSSNTIKVEALDIYGKTDTSEEITVSTINLAPKDVVVYLTWDQPGVDLDLHIRGPRGEHTFYAALDIVESSEAIPQGALDLDDKNGFGPEVFSMSGADEGVYTIEARYHHSQENRPSQAQVTVVLYPTEPARRVTRVFGPRELSPGEAEWTVTGLKFPEGVFTSP